MSMKTNNIYSSPVVNLIFIETEQVVCAQSGAGGTEDLFDSKEDFNDLFE